MNSFKELLKQKLINTMKMLNLNITITEEVNNVLSVFIKEHKFCIDIIDGLYVQADNDYTDLFDYYNGSEVLDVDGETSYEFNSNANVDWSFIMETDSFIKTAYVQAFNDMKAIWLSGKRVSPSIFGEGKYITKEGVEFVRATFDKNLKEIMRLYDPKNADALIYNTVAYPNYADYSSIVIYVETGYSRSAYALDCNSKEFFVEITLRDKVGCKYSTTFPWLVEHNTNLFSIIPGAIDESRDFKSALQIVVDKTLVDIANVITSGKANVTMFVDDKKDMHMLTPDNLVDLFTNELHSSLYKYYPHTLNEMSTKEDMIRTYNRPDGITRIAFGMIVCDIAIGSCGTVDIGLIRELCPEDTFDDIIYTNNVIDITTDCTLDDLNLVTWGGDTTLGITEGLCDIIAEVMYAINNGI